MSISADTLQLLIDQGIAGDALVAIVRSIEADKGPSKSAAAERQRRYRERQKVGPDRDVTRDVTASVTDRDGASSLDKKAPQTPEKINLISGVYIADAREADPVGVPVRAQIAANQVAVAILLVALSDARERQVIDASVDLWNAMAKRTGLAVVKSLTDERRKRLRARITEHGPDAFTEAIAAVERSGFCLGDSRDGWRANFDFLLQASSFTKLIEGSYDRSINRSGSSRAAGSFHPGGRTGAAADDVFGGGQMH